MPPQQPGPGSPEGGWPPGQPGTGGQPHPAQGPYGYPQQGSPYGPQQGQQPPYGQPAYGAQPGAGYGAPYGGGAGPGGPGQGPPGGGSGKTLALIVAAVLVGVLVIGGVVFAVGSNDDDGGKRDETKSSDGPSTDPSDRPSPTRASPTPSASGGPESTYKVVLPKSLESGKYTLEKDLSASTDEQVPDSGSGARGVKPATGRYVTTGRTAELVVTGLNGTFASPEYAKNSFFRGLESNDNAEVGVPRRDITPAGSDTTLTCEVVLKHQGGQKLVMPMCAWADTTTLVAVVENTLATVGKDPSSIDLEAFAARVAGMRKELLVTTG